MPVALPLAIVGAAGIGAAASMSASNKAAKVAKQTAADNNALQLQIYGENKAALAPFVGAGGPATAAIQALTGLAPGGAAAQEAAFNAFRNSTGYQDRFNEGRRAVTSALGNKGLLDSG